MSHNKSETSSTAALKQKMHEENHDAEQEQPSDSIEVLQEKCREAEEKAAKSFDQLLRMQADMENTRRRLERDVTSAQKFALEKFILELLPIVDGLERALAAHAAEESGSGSLLDGVGMTLKMVRSAFEKFGVQVIDPLGSPFNPEHHQAISTQVDDTVKPGTILNVLQKGYLLHERLIRPALVIVSKNGS
ncbi:MAG: nucleotide exchange factor GrpE [Gammaproteobacteria bacterium]|nr:nucleotide exchange factor GrpE [Gammaproteobacteria bacterium]